MNDHEREMHDKLIYENKDLHEQLKYQKEQHKIKDEIISQYLNLIVKLADKV